MTDWQEVKKIHAVADNSCRSSRIVLDWHEKTDVAPGNTCLKKISAYCPLI